MIKRFNRDERRKPSRLWLVECRLLGHRTVKISGEMYKVELLKHSLYMYVYCHTCSRTIYREDKPRDK